MRLGVILLPYGGLRKSAMGGKRTIAAIRYFG
jgi:hypothetical protein